MNLTDAALIEIVNKYCGYEAGVRNLNKCLDRIFRKLVAKIEFKKIKEIEASVDGSSLVIEEVALDKIINYDEVKEY